MELAADLPGLEIGCMCAVVDSQLVPISTGTQVGKVLYRGSRFSCKMLIKEIKHKMVLSQSKTRS